jgi:hypothetical protein
MSARARRPLWAACTLVVLVVAMLGGTVSAYGQPAYTEANPKTAPAAAPTTFTEPYLLSLTPQRTMDILWLTPEAARDSYVEYGTTPKYGCVIPAKTYHITGMRSADASGNYTIPLKVYQQIGRLSGLAPGKRYYYRVVTKSGTAVKVGKGYDFKTAPTRRRPVSFVLLSDLQLKAQIPSTVKLAGQQRADFIVYNGDLQNTPYKSGEWFDVPGTSEPSDLRWFNVMQQTADGARLMQYMPIYPSPGNHEIDDQAVLNVKSVKPQDAMKMSIYLQLFRTLYPSQQPAANGKHWYAVDFGSMHIVSLSVLRWFAWPADQAPGWPLFDDIKVGSPQYEWLKRDLKNSKDAAYTWVTQHWHMYGRGHETDIAYTDPVTGADGKMTYPASADYLQRDLKPLFETYGVDGLSYGHSHVYERYVINGVNYVEAATIGNTYRVPSDPPLNALGLAPAADENRFRSFMLLKAAPTTGLHGYGIQASVEASGGGYIGRIFDDFLAAPALPEETACVASARGSLPRLTQMLTHP